MDTFSRLHFPYINSILKVFTSMVMVLVPMITSAAPLPVPAEVKIRSSYLIMTLIFVISEMTLYL